MMLADEECHHGLQIVGEENGKALEGRKLPGWVV